VTTPPMVDRGKPAVVHVPKYKHSRGNDIHALLDDLGLVSMPWHEVVLRHAMAFDQADKWLVQHVAVQVPWLDEKDHLVRLRTAVGAAVFGERVVHMSGSLTLAGERFQALLDVVRGSKVLDELTRMVRRTHGGQQIEFHGGGSIKFRAHSQRGGGARGLTADLLVIDDARGVTYDEALLNHVPTLVNAKDGPHIWWMDTRREHDPREPLGPYPVLLKQALTPKAAPVLYLEWADTP
jgi:hypothetical protein